MMNEVEESLVNAAVRPLRVSEYEALAGLGVFDQERVELIRGRVVKMAPQREEHAWGVMKLTDLLVKAFGEVAFVRPQLPLRVGEDSLPEPDFALVPRTSGPTAHPTRAFLVIEVSQSSLRFDREVKAPLYAEGVAPEYWVVNVQTNQLEVFRAPRDGLYTERFVLGPADTVRPVAFPEIAIPLAGLLVSAQH